MRKMRQDAWTEEEDILLASTVLRFIKKGKTQLDAFKLVGEQLSRTPAACGFRWNASIRHKHTEAINEAKQNRQQSLQHVTNKNMETETIETAIALLEEMKGRNRTIDPQSELTKERKLTQLQTENKRLQLELDQYKAAWVEFRNIWEWLDKNRHVNE